jgi:hypothetical protein
MEPEIVYYKAPNIFGGVEGVDYYITSKEPYGGRNKK